MPASVSLSRKRETNIQTYKCATLLQRVRQEKDPLFYLNSVGLNAESFVTVYGRQLSPELKAKLCPDTRIREDWEKKHERYLMSRITCPEMPNDRGLCFKPMPQTKKERRKGVKSYYLTPLAPTTR